MTALIIVIWAFIAEALELSRGLSEKNRYNKSHDNVYFLKEYKTNNVVEMNAIEIKFLLQL